MNIETLIIFGAVTLIVAAYIVAILLAVKSVPWVDWMVARARGWAERKRLLAERRLRANKVTMAGHILRRV